MATLKTLYGTSTAITCTLNSLNSAAARQSTVVDNSSNLYLDVLVGGSFKTATGSLGTNPTVNIYAFAITDGTNYGGTNGSNTLGGGDAAFTLPTNKGNLRLVAVVPLNASNATEYMQPASVAMAFGGTLPDHWGLVVENQTGLALNSSGGGSVSYVGIQLQTA